MEVTLSPAFLETNLAHQEYQMGLSYWNKFVVWSYTLGSGTVNSHLLGIHNQASLRIWSVRIAETWRDTSKGKHKPPKAYKAFYDYLEGKTYLTEKEIFLFLDIYIKNLQRIIMKSPALKGDITVYKASSKYPGLEVGDVFQIPFNSTSYRVDFNFSMFLPPDGFCCMHKITLPKGSRALILAPSLSAYPDESEVILPHSVTFEVKKISKTVLDVPREFPKKNLFNIIQEGEYVLGPVYAYNYKANCRTEKHYVDFYISTLIE